MVLVANWVMNLAFVSWMVATTQPTRFGLTPVLGWVGFGEYWVKLAWLLLGLFGEVRGGFPHDS